MNNATLIYKTYDRIAKSSICKKSPRAKGKKKSICHQQILFF